MGNPILYTPEILKKIVQDVAKQYGNGWMSIPDPGPDLARTQVLVSVLYAITHPEWSEGLYCARCLDPILKPQPCPACGVHLCITCLSAINTDEEWYNEEPLN